MQYYNFESILRMKHFQFILNETKINFQYYNNSKRLSSYFNIVCNCTNYM